MQRSGRILGVVLLGLGIGGVDVWGAPGQVRLERIFEGVEVHRPVSLVYAPEGSALGERGVLVQQRGLVLLLPEDEVSGTEVEVLLDLTGWELEGHEFEEGLLGLAFHPGFVENGRVFVFFTQQGPKRTRVSEFRFEDGVIQPESERILLEVAQPFWNHNSGNLLFGPDGMLYVAIGDGGKRDDIVRLSQNLMAHHGKVMRIDVDAEGEPFGVPADNPFVGREDALPEIYAYGLRNPWGMSFDGEGRLWLADVGQDLFEEINLIEAGGNYGWSFREGKIGFVHRKDEPSSGEKMIEPVAVYGRELGLSVTGGYVYEGTGVPGLAGHYLYGDWGSGRFWALAAGDPGASEAVVIFEAQRDDKGRGAVQPTAIVPDWDGEPVVLDWNGGMYQVVGGEF
jgi:glucose/arabinose dehydrogenase